ncbi:MAG TPA: glycosyltransferase family 39 protein, partial [Candidatus Saccharimonadales bacterium]|nr:glycosyltransferase family 39 protein [Candidatus Saccharimonadales bacterium]
MKTAQATAPRIEFVTAVALSLWVVALHLVFLFHAGPLWRDEVGTIDFAAMPTLGDIWHNLQYDNFPPLFVALARVWTLAGLSSDFNYRTLGFLIGMGTLAVLWYGAYQLGGKPPLLALALYAVNPLAISVGDAMRPYGLGIILNLLTLALFWKFVQSPSRKNFVWAAIGAVLSVQCLYQNAFFVCAFTVGAWVVTLARRDRTTALKAGWIALLAALSLLPHLGNLHKARDWAVITTSVVHLAPFVKALAAALQADGRWMTPVWLGLGVVGLTVAATDGIKLRRWN